MKSKKNNPSVPSMYVCLSYSDVYDDFSSVDPSNFIKDIPTLPMLHFVTELQNKILYAFTDIQKQTQVIYEMCGFLPNAKKKRVWNFIKEHKSVLFMTNMTAFLFYRLSLSYYESLDNYKDESIKLYQDERIDVYKALLYCNQIWTTQQEKDRKSMHDFIDFSLCAEMPIIEFKFHKDFSTQLYKSICFFEFCEKDPLFSTYLSSFYKDHQVLNWQEYLLKLFQFYQASLSSQYIKVDSQYIFDICFFNQYSIQPADDKIKKLWNNKELGFNYLRNRFLMPIDGNNYLLLNANLLIDKLYQGMKFDFFTSIKQHKLKNGSNKIYKGFPEFNSVLGERFSEKNLLYPLLYKIYSNKANKILSSIDIKNSGITVNEPDFYLRCGNVLYLFEHKDLILGDRFKYSSDINEIKRALLERLCFDGQDADGNNKRKGGGQLLYTINEIVNNHMMDRLDTDVSSIKEIYPIIITTDVAFSAIGVNALVIKEFENLIKKYNFPKHVYICCPVILDYDILLKLSWRLATNRLSLQNLIFEYVKVGCDKHKLEPFNTYIRDCYLRKKKDQDKYIEFLFEDKLQTWLKI